MHSRFVWLGRMFLGIEGGSLLLILSVSWKISNPPWSWGSESIIQSHPCFTRRGFSPCSLACAGQTVCVRPVQWSRPFLSPGACGSPLCAWICAEREEREGRRQPHAESPGLRFRAQLAACWVLPLSLSFLIVKWGGSPSSRGFGGGSGEFRELRSRRRRWEGGVSPGSTVSPGWGHQPVSCRAGELAHAAWAHSKYLICALWNGTVLTR